MNTVNNFILGMESCYREFDSSSFLAVSQNLYNEGASMLIDVSNDIYGKSISDAVNDLSDIWVNAIEFTPFMKSLENSAKQSLGAFPRLHSTDIKFNFDYLKDYDQNLTRLIAQMYQAATEGTLDNSALSVFLKVGADELSDTVKHQIVRSSIADLYTLDPKVAMTQNSLVVIDWSKSYVKNFVLPFVSTFNGVKATTIAEAKQAMSLIQELISSANIRNQKVSEICQKNPEYASKINQCNYKLNRGFIDVISFVTYAVLRKIHALVNNSIVCNDALAKIKSVTPYAEQTLIREGVYGSSILSDATGDLADALMARDSSAYEDLAGNIMEFHRGMLINRGISGLEDPDSTLDGMIDEREYRKDAYNSIMEILCTLSASLDKMSAASDDYLLATDDLLEKAGLDNPIDVRYAERIKITSDTTEYDKACDIAVEGNGNLDIYLTILHEVKDFPQNIKTIAENIGNVKEKMNILEKRYSDPVSQPWKITDEYKNTAAIKELSNFMISLKEQYGNMVNMIAGNMMARLKKLAINAEKISVKMDEDREEPIGVQESDEMDYALEMDKLQYEYEHGVTEILMKALQDTYVEAWYEKVRGVKMYEVGDPVGNGNGGANATPAGTNSVNAGGTNQAQAAQGAANKSANIGMKLNELKDTINKKFQEIIKKFTQNMSTRAVTMDNGQSMVYSLWIKQNKAELLSHNYTNQSVQILPYNSKMPWDSILSDITKFTGVIGNMKSDTLGNSKEGDVVSKCFSNYNLATTGSTAAEMCKSITTPLTNYFKLGPGNHDDLQAEVATYADSGLKSEMSNIANFCEMYYASGMNKLTSALGGVENALSMIASTYVTESVTEKMDDLLVLLEDGENGDTSKSTVKVNTNVNKDANNANGDQSTSTKSLYDAIQQCVFTYNGCVMNAVRDRINDFFKAMKPFVKGQGAANNTGANGAQAQPAQQPVQQQ